MRDATQPHRPRVAIITPFRNAGRYIADMMASVREQSLTDWEHVLVDDGSVDDSLRIVQEVAALDSRIRVFSHANAGVSRSRNVGARVSGKPDYLLFLDADDILEPSMLESLVAYLDEHQRAGVCYCSFSEIIDDTWHAAPVRNVRYSPRAFTVRRVAPRQPETPFETLSMWGGILPSNALIRRTAFEASGGFDERYAAAEDTDLFMRLGLIADVHFLNQPLMRYRRHGLQASWDADATSKALDRMLAEKWVATSMPKPHRRRVARAKNLRRYGASALEGVRFGTQHVRAGDLGAGLRFYAGAARRYVLYCAANLASIVGLVE